MADEKDNLKALYTQICDSYQKVDDFRAKLLGFLPLASGVTIFSLLNTDGQGLITQHLSEIGVFGVLLTLGLLIYEMKGIQKCTSFIYYGQAIEQQLLEGYTPPLSGQFMALWKKEYAWKVVTEPVASAFIYVTVLTAWIYVALMQVIVDKPTYIFICLFAFIVFWVVAFTTVYRFWRHCFTPPPADDGKYQGSVKT